MFSALQRCKVYALLCKKVRFLDTLAHKDERTNASILLVICITILHEHISDFMIY